MHRRSIRKIILTLAVTAFSAGLPGATLYKVTGEIGSATSHNTADDNIPVLHGFTFYFGTGPIPNYVGAGSLEGDFNSGFTSLAYNNGLIDLDYTNTADNGFGFVNPSEATEWDPVDHTLELEATQLVPVSTYMRLLLQFAPGFAGSGPAIAEDSSLRLLWIGKFQGSGQQIEAYYSIVSATVSVVSDSPGTVVPEPGTASVITAGILLLLAGGGLKRRDSRS